MQTSYKNQQLHFLILTAGKSKLDLLDQLLQVLFLF